MYSEIAFRSATACGPAAFSGVPVVRAKVLLFRQNRLVFSGRHTVAYFAFEPFVVGDEVVNTLLQKLVSAFVRAPRQVVQLSFGFGGQPSYGRGESGWSEL